LRLHPLGQWIGAVIFLDLDRVSGGPTMNIGRTGLKIGISTGTFEASDRSDSVKSGRMMESGSALGSDS
jgi:hypothetical protein